MRYNFLLVVLIFLTTSAWCQVEKKESMEEAPKRTNAYAPAQKTAVQLKGEYMSTRSNCYSRNGKHISFAEQKKLDDIVDQLEQSYSSAYEHLFVQMVNANFGDTFTTFFEATVAKRKTKELTPYGVANAFITNNNDAALKWLQTYHQQYPMQDQDKEYAQNLMKSVEHNSILFTYGKEDTYPLLVMQHIFNYRTDISVINLEWLQNEAYRSRIVSSLGIRYTGKVIGDESNWIRSCQSSDKALYFANSIPPKALQASSGQLYCTGLAFKLSVKQYNNIKILESNWTSFDKKEMFEHSASGDALKANYIFGLLQLYNHYKLTNQTKSSTYLKAIQKIGKIANKTAIVEQLIND